MRELFAQPVISIILERDGIADCILLQKRIKSEPAPLKNLWELPQGRLRRGESLLDCVARELKEETGLEKPVLRVGPKRLAVLGEKLEAIEGITVIETGQHSYLAICLICTASGVPRSSSESSDPGWYKKADVLRLIATKKVFPLNVPMLLAYFDLTP